MSKDDSVAGEVKTPLLHSKPHKETHKLCNKMQQTFFSCPRGIPQPISLCWVLQALILMVSLPTSIGSKVVDLPNPCQTPHLPFHECTWNEHAKVSGARFSRFFVHPLSDLRFGSFNKTLTLTSFDNFHEMAQTSCVFGYVLFLRDCKVGKPRYLFASKRQSIVATDEDLAQVPTKAAVHPLLVLSISHWPLGPQTF